MNTVQCDTLQVLAREIVNRLTVEVEASGRHVHLSRAHLDALFGPGYQLNRVRDLSQPGQFVCAERVTLVGPGGQIENVVVLGPERKESQVEISLTDGRALGITPPVRISGDIAGTPGITLRRGDREIHLQQGVVAAKRHIHMTPADAARWGVADKQQVRLKCLTARPVTFEQVEVRVSPQFATAAHIDYDEANACGFAKGDRGMIVK
jgi:putative phosphotransacetylase